MEFGAYWHGCDWRTHKIADKKTSVKLTRSLFRGESEQEPQSPVGDKDVWKWVSPKPEDWDPIVRMGDGLAVVTFYTISELGGAAIFRHVDTFHRGSYSFTSDVETIAQGPGGYVF